MDQLYNFVGNYLLANPKLLAVLVAYLAVVKIIAITVDALVSSRAEWDATPLTDDTWYEQAFTVVVRAVKFLAKIAAALSGFRPKPKAETVLEDKNIIEKK